MLLVKSCRYVEIERDGCMSGEIGRASCRERVSR